MYANGIDVTLADGRVELVRAALFFVACDIPASRKVCGFTAPGATCGCNKCANQWDPNPKHSLSRDYSNFNMHEWIPRTKEQNRQRAAEWEKVRTDQERKSHERLYGTRVTELHRLRYFDPIRCTTIDPMHNLFSGTASRMTHQWIKMELLTKRHLATMEEQLESMSKPPGYLISAGHLRSGFAGMTSDEWRSWTVLYSIPLLIGKLHSAHLENWQHFVDAVRILCQPSITRREVDEAHDRFLKFCRGCVSLYGAAFITPNMHLHCHLREVVNDFGPVYGFWLFSFERYNGIIKSIDTNSKDRFEVTFMKQFLKQSMSSSLTDALLEAGPHTLGYHLTRLMVSPVNADVLAGISYNHMEFESFASLQTPPFGSIIPCGWEPLPPSSFSMATGDLVFMHRDHYPFLVEYYQRVYADWCQPVSVITTCTGPNMVQVNDRIHKIPKIDILGQTFFSMASRQTRLGCAIAITLSKANGERYLAPARPLYYFKHTFRDYDHYFAMVEWYNPSRHSWPTYHLYGCTACHATTAPLSMQSIVPVHYIHSVVSLSTIVDDHLLVRFLPRKIKTEC